MNICNFGWFKNYQYNLSVGYDLFIKYLFFLQGWVIVKVQYQGSYNWIVVVLNVDSFGNVIQNN